MSCSESVSHWLNGSFPDDVLFLSPSPFDSFCFLPLWFFIPSLPLLCLLFSPWLFFLLPWRTVYFLFSSFDFPWFQSPEVVLFQKIPMSVYSLPFSSLYWVSPVCSSLSEYYILAFRFLSCNNFLLVCSSSSNCLVYLVSKSLMTIRPCSLFISSNGGK